MSYPYNPAKRAALVEALIKWAKEYPAAADCLFDDPGTYIDDIDNAKSDIEHHENGSRHWRMSDHDADDAYYIINAEEARIKAVRDIERRFSVAKAAE